MKLDRYLAYTSICLSSFAFQGCDRAARPSDIIGPSEVSGASAPVTYPSNGPDLVAYVAERYPDRLAAGVSHEERIANMEFLRDRIIEIGICGGMNIGWNMKRGGPEKSKDFVAWHDGGRYMGVDIAYAYDAPHRRLQLMWDIYGPTSHYREYQPRPNCSQLAGTAAANAKGIQETRDQDTPVSLRDN